VGDGEAETGPLATTGTRQILNPARDGAVLSDSLTLTATKSPAPTFWAEFQDELDSLFVVMVYTPLFCRGATSLGDAPTDGNPTLDRFSSRSKNIQQELEANGFEKRRSWPMISAHTEGVDRAQGPLMERRQKARSVLTRSR